MESPKGNAEFEVALRNLDERGKCEASNDWGALSFGYFFPKGTSFGHLGMQATNGSTFR
jgi:hypothetical protein